MAEIMYNSTGTTSNYYKIGKKGISIFQGQTDPSDSSGKDGDVYFLVSSNPKMFRKINGTWEQYGVKRTTSVNTNSTVTINHPDVVIMIDSSTSAINVTLDASNISNGYQVNLKDFSGNSSVNSITINTNNSETIDGNSQVVMDNDYMSLTLVYYNSNWYII